MMPGVILDWLDGHPAGCLLPATIATVVLLAASLSSLRPAPAAGAPAHRWLFPILMLLVLLCWRWPFLTFADELNTDESQFIAGALTLRHDPLFWRSVDGMTAGPLVYYALLPWTLLGLPLGYFAARLTALLLIWLALWITYRTIRARYGEAPARLGLLPGVIFLSTITSGDLNHYSSEIASLPLTAAGIALLCPTGGRLPTTWRWLLTGLVAGLHPWAKLQTGPIGALIVLAGLLLILRRPGPTRRTKLVSCGALVAGSLVPAVVVTVVTLLGGVWSDFFQGYVVQNLLYAGENLPLPWLQPGFFSANPSFLTLCLSLGTPLALIVLAGGLGRKPGRLFLLGGPLFLIALFCVLYPGRAFLHYTLLLVVPLLTWSGAALGECQRLPARRMMAATALGITLVGCIGLLATRLAAPPPPQFGQFSQQWTNPRTEVNSVIDLLTNPGEKLAVWGWHAQSYVKSALRQGTREAYSFWSIRKSPLQAWHRRIFLEDFRRNRPEVLLDSVGPNALFFQDRSASAHETFPELADLVDRDYVLVIDLDYARIYARRDIVRQRNISPSAVRDALAQGRPPQWIERNLRPENLRAQAGSHNLIAGRDVLMMLPPSEASWVLEGEEREILFQTGYDPRAIDQPEGNGTEFVLELRAPDGGTRVIHTFLCNPRDVPADQRLRHRRVALPPYEPGTRLNIRTTPGPDANNAWDWAYLTNVRFLRSPHYTWRQFPGFNRMPDFASSPLSTHIRKKERSILLLHAPAQFGYTLGGHERHLRFAYGFTTGAHNARPGTNGATFRVEAQLPDGTVTALARRQMIPLAQPGDRGRQLMRLDLPEFPASTRLTVTVDPNGSNSFDWTYVTDLWLE